ncbi:hypothetical protein FGO68_gene11655 [Halteria grandinella]|uniref:Uncharacterized protein n=1 Tax=Halteria grandinella TaxID=5974 RepID=A0A8J8TAN4_HALGN|nr:hypothetical protein FGO68_gene11655 [Halteria grandinella]
MTAGTFTLISQQELNLLQTYSSERSSIQDCISQPSAHLSTTIIWHIKASAENSWKYLAKRQWICSKHWKKQLKPKRFCISLRLSLYKYPQTRSGISLRTFQLTGFSCHLFQVSCKKKIHNKKQDSTVRILFNISMKKATKSLEYGQKMTSLVPPLNYSFPKSSTKRQMCRRTSLRYCTSKDSSLTNLSRMKIKWKMPFAVFQVFKYRREKKRSTLTFKTCKQHSLRQFKRKYAKKKERKKARKSCLTQFFNKKSQVSNLKPINLKVHLLGQMTQFCNKRYGRKSTKTYTNSTIQIWLRY